MSPPDQTMSPAGPGPQRRPGVNRRNSTSSSSTASVVASRRGSEYWNNLICLFSGVGQADLKDARALPKEYMDQNYDGRRGSIASRQSSTRRSSSMFGRRPTSQSEESLSSTGDAKTRKLQRRTGQRLGAVPESDIGHFQSPQPSPLEQRMATIPYFQALSPGSLPAPMPRATNWPLQGQTASEQQSGGSEPKMIGIWKDGEMHWIREDIVSALTMGAPQNFGSPTSSMQPPQHPSTRPNMRINIPASQYNTQVQSYRPPSPTASLSSVYTELPMQSNKQHEPHLSYPNETSVILDQFTPGESPSSTKSIAYTGSSSWGDEQSSPVTQYSSEGSASIFDNSPKISVTRNYSAKNATAAGTFDQLQAPPVPRNRQAIPRTPTLDQAENDLRQELGNFQEEPTDTSFVPPLPTRSRARESYVEVQSPRRTSTRQITTTKPESVYRAQSTKRDSVVQEPQPQKKRASRISKAFTFRRKRAAPAAEPKKEKPIISSPVIAEEQLPKRVVNRRASTTIERHVEDAKISADAAEMVIYHIFENVNGFDDLFAFARINKGFFSVFKRNEFTLIKSVHYNVSPAAWELRQTAPGEIIANNSASTSEYTPSRYMQFLQRDNLILSSLKRVIYARCQPFLRLETVEALREKDTERSRQLDNALWRIWTFCYLFGGSQGRESDVAAQIEWLRGGLITRRTSSSSTFGRGNVGGLTAEELYDITELWNCIKALVAGVQGPGAVAQARLIGVFKGKHVKKGDADSQETLLDEWLSYLVTLGLSTVLDIANSTNESKPNAFFSTASEMGWSKWTAPALGSSRGSFLRDAVSRVYEEKIATFHPAPSAQAREEAKERTARFAAELKEMKRATAGSDLGADKQPRLSSWLSWIEGVDAANAEQATTRGRTPSRQDDAPSSPRTSSQPTSLFSSRFGKKNKEQNKRSHSSHPSADTTSSATTASSAGAHSTNDGSDAGTKSPTLSACTSVYSTRPSSPVNLGAKTLSHVTTAAVEV